MTNVWNEEALELFWKFVAERQIIWYRRFVTKLPPPWTDDPILQKNKFTNVYRELDPGTIFAKENILEQSITRPERVFNIMIYRLICSIPTYEYVGFQYLKNFDWVEFEERLAEIYRTGQPVFGNAYLISPYSSMGGNFKYENVARLFGVLKANFEDFWNALENASSLEEAFKVVNSQYGFGPFLAYQVCVDLMYPLEVDDGKSILPFTHDDWARLGPGALRGLARLTSVSSTRESLIKLRWLRDNQTAYFEHFGIYFPRLKDKEGNLRPISLSDMQNCLCEFSKYMNIRNGTGKPQRLFVSAEERERGW